MMLILRWWWRTWRCITPQNHWSCPSKPSGAGSSYDLPCMDLRHCYGTAHLPHVRTSWVDTRNQRCQVWLHLLKISRLPLWCTVELIMNWQSESVCWLQDPSCGTRWSGLEFPYITV
jgi:hypothetical protein